MEAEEVIKTIAKYQTAIRIFDGSVKCGYVSITLDDALEEAKVYASKQIPKKPILKRDIGFIHRDFADGSADTIRTESDSFHCPCCDAVVGELYKMPNGRTHKQRKKKFCDRCGNRIDWEESEES